MAKTGRPKKDVRIKQFEELCKIQCSKEEICNVLDVTDKTLDKWIKETYTNVPPFGENVSFSEVFKYKRTDGHTALRRHQFRMAETNTTMAIWLGKQWLGQTDKTDIGGTMNVQSDGLFRAIKDGLDKGE